MLVASPSEKLKSNSCSHFESVYFSFIDTEVGQPNGQIIFSSIRPGLNGVVCHCSCLSASGQRPCEFTK